MLAPTNSTLFSLFFEFLQVFRQLVYIRPGALLVAPGLRASTGYCQGFAAKLNGFKKCVNRHLLLLTVNDPVQGALVSGSVPGILVYATPLARHYVTG